MKTGCFFSIFKTNEILNLELKTLFFAPHDVLLPCRLELIIANFSTFSWKKAYFGTFFPDVMELFKCDGEIVLLFHRN